VAAAALEQSMLESKDKDTLLEMAKALGVKANARLKKAEIIDKILDTTGTPNGAADPAEAAEAAESGGKRSGADSGATRTDVDRTDVGHVSTPADATPDAAEPTAEASSGEAVVRLGADGEPLADWELALADESDAAAGGSDAAADTGRSSSNESTGGNRAGQQGGARNDRSRAGSQRDGRQADRQQRSGAQGDAKQGDAKQGDAKQGDAKQGDAKQGGNRGNQQGGNRNRNDEQGDGNRRRRRRRKNRGGQEGPQGEDLELLDDDGQPQNTEPQDVEGYLDIRDEGYGFLRVKGFLPSKEDVYIPLKIARQYGLRKGDHLTGKARPAQRNEKNPGLLEVYTVNGGQPDAAKRRPRFEDLTALFPDQRLTLEDPSDPANMTARIIDLVSPIGKGQRGIIVSPPKAGKTTIMKTIAKSIELNNPEVELLVLLIDERPEEVTDMRRTVKGEVVASTFDRPSDEHTHVAEMAIARAKRRVEDGKDVVIMLDGITRLSRAYNLAAPASGRILSGGIDAGALYPPKKFFGAARNVEEGGSLTILATALVDTNSRMDEAIFEEFKGTGNMELRLDRKVAERRIYPAIDVDASSTRHEELLFDRKQLQQVWKLRRVLSGLAQDGSAAAGLELLIDRLKTFRTNDEFLAEIAKQPSM